MELHSPSSPCLANNSPYHPAFLPAQSSYMGGSRPPSHVGQISQRTHGTTHTAPASYAGSAPPYTGSAPPYAGSTPPCTGSAPPYSGSAPPYSGSAPPYSGSAHPCTGSSHLLNSDGNSIFINSFICLNFPLYIHIVTTIIYYFKTR